MSALRGPLTFLPGLLILLSCAGLLAAAADVTQRPGGRATGGATLPPTARADLSDASGCRRGEARHVPDLPDEPGPGTARGLVDVSGPRGGHRAGRRHVPSLWPRARARHRDPGLDLPGRRQRRTRRAGPVPRRVAAAGQAHAASARQPQSAARRAVLHGGGQLAPPRRCLHARAPVPAARLRRLRAPARAWPPAARRGAGGARGASGEARDPTREIRAVRFGWRRMARISRPDCRRCPCPRGSRRR